MIVMLEPDSPESVVSAVLKVVSQFKGVTPRTHVMEGAEYTVTEVYLLGSTAQVPVEPFEQIPGVRQVVRVSQKYRVIGRHKGQRASTTTASPSTRSRCSCSRACAPWTTART